MTCQCAWSVIFPPRSMAFWAKGGSGAGRASPGGGDCLLEGRGRKVTRPPLTGHMTQDPRDPSQWPRDMASMALLSQDVMFWSLWKLRWVWGAPIRLCGVGNGWEQGGGISGSGMGFMTPVAVSEHSFPSCQIVVKNSNKGPHDSPAPPAPDTKTEAQGRVVLTLGHRVRSETGVLSHLLTLPQGRGTGGLHSSKKPGSGQMVVE